MQIDRRPFQMFFLSASVAWRGLAPVTAMLLAAVALLGSLPAFAADGASAGKSEAAADSTAVVTVAPGPAADMRVYAAKLIGIAKSRGVGVKPYEEMFETIENDVREGKPEAEIASSAKRLSAAIYRQLHSARDLKGGAVGGSGVGGRTAADYRRYVGKVLVSPSVIESLIFDFMNADRRKHGLSSLKRNSRLAALARAHSDNMAKNKFFSHSSPDGKGPMERAKDAGLVISIYENIATVPSSRGDSVHKARLAEKGLMNSPPHRANILNEKFKTVGMGVSYRADGDMLVTQDFSKDDP